MAQAPQAATADAALLVGDIQPDFLPGGALPVADPGDLLERVCRLMESGRFGLQVAIQDWHPPDHVSFASNHPGRQVLDNIDLYGHEQTLWPDHCVQGSPGSALHPALPWERVTAIIRKGSDPTVDSYSGFRNNWDRHGQRPPTGLAGYLRERGIEAVYLCGLARDFCVKWSAEDAAAAGFRTYVIWDATCPVDAASDPRVRAELEARGVMITTVQQCLADRQGAP